MRHTLGYVTLTATWTVQAWTVDYDNPLLVLVTDLGGNVTRIDYDPALSPRNNAAKGVPATVAALMQEPASLLGYLGEADIDEDTKMVTQVMAFPVEVGSVDTGIF